MYIYQRLVIMYLMGLKSSSDSYNLPPTLHHLLPHIYILGSDFSLYKKTKVTTLLCTLLRCRALLAYCIYCSISFFSTKSSWLSNCDSKSFFLRTLKFTCFHWTCQSHNWSDTTLLLPLLLNSTSEYWTITDFSQLYLVPTNQSNHICTLSRKLNCLSSFYFYQ